MVEQGPGRGSAGWPRLILLGFLSLFWALAAGRVLPYQLSAMGPRILPPDDAARYWAYAFGAAVPAALVAVALSRRCFACGQSRATWMAGCFVTGIGAALGAVIGGAVVFALDSTFRVAAEPDSIRGPLWMSLPSLFAAFGILAFLSGSGLALIEGSLVAAVTVPLVLLLRAWVCRGNEAPLEYAGSDAVDTGHSGG